MAKGNEQQKDAGPRFPKPVKGGGKSKALANGGDVNDLHARALTVAARFRAISEKVNAGAPVTRAQVASAANSLRAISKKADLMDLGCMRADGARQREAATAKAKLDRAQARLDKALADTNKVRKEQGLALLGADGKEVAG